MCASFFLFSSISSLLSFTALLFIVRSVFHLLFEFVVSSSSSPPALLLCVAFEEEEEEEEEEGAEGRGRESEQRGREESN